MVRFCTSHLYYSPSVQSLCIAFFFLEAPDGYPEITDNPILRVVEVGVGAIMNCQATGSPPPTYTWLKDRVPVNLTDPRITVLENGNFF